MNYIDHLKKMCLLLVVVSILFGVQSSMVLSADSVPPTPESFLPVVLRDEGSDKLHNPEDMIFEEVSSSEQLAIAGFWTRERMLEANALPLPLLEGVDVTETIGLQEATVSPREVISGGLPEPGMNELAQSLYPQEWVVEDSSIEVVNEDYQLELQGYSYPPPFSRYFVNAHTEMWKEYPWKTMGRLFFKIPGLSGYYSCSASVAYGRAIWTAGHCVYTRGRGWHTNMIFVPAYRNGSMPYGTFTIIKKSVLRGWADGKHAYDIAVVVARDKNGRKVGQWVGHLGVIWNANSLQHFHAFGYPGNLTNSSKYLIACAASTSRRDGRTGPDPIGIGCDMQHGSSGGPWIVQYDPYRAGWRNYVNGVVSYGYNQTRPLEFYSPYFGTGAKNLYNWGKNQ